MADVFAGKICIVTGGTSGIGFAVSEALLKRGATVYAVGIPAEGVKAAAKKMAGYPRARFAAVDVTDYEAVQKLVDDVVAECGRLDYMFNNAGIGATVQFEKVTLDFWKKVVDINLWGVIHGVHAAFPVMAKQGSGHIVNTSSVAGILAPPYQAVYSATKFAVTGLTEALRYEHEYRGIAFSTICPGNVATEIFDGIEPPPDAISPAEAAGIILAGVERKEGLIIFPEHIKQLYLAVKADQEKMDAVMRDMAETRRKAYETGGKYY
ncbi:SDR family oxidoreductase [Anaeroselena agilis]|uniref:SDR family oxidoreductase n=1 Tax=Anaeroselena agilis TaxID=3063788 RepID=A0ABU3NSF5_9FIRM|nr:SDR family oxidoreductase [Selenomonadales bacterium 4137-cl]